MKEIDYTEFKKLKEGKSNTRAEILKLLEERPMRRIELAEIIGIHPQGIYLHLVELKDKVIMKKKGNKVYWGLKSMVKE